MRWPLRILSGSSYRGSHASLGDNRTYRCVMVLQEKNKYITRLAVGLRCGAPRVPENPLLASLVAALRREGLLAKAQGSQSTGSKAEHLSAGLCLEDFEWIHNNYSLFKVSSKLRIMEASTVHDACSFESIEESRGDSPIFNSSSALFGSLENLFI